MYLIPLDEMPQKLSKSWAFLRGENVAFTRSSDLPYALEKHFISIVLPVYYDDATQLRSLAIALLIDEAEAINVASHMFGLSATELSTEDIKDACKESCNVLGGSLVKHEHNRLGIPQEITQDDFLMMEQDARLHVSFTSESPQQLLTLMIADVTPQKSRSE